MGRLQVKNLGIILGKKKILNDISIDFWDGHIHAIVGPNGAGKSTLASIIMGRSAYRDFEGDVVFNDESLKPLDIHQRARRGITMAWQEPARFEGLSVSSFILAGATDKSRETVDYALNTVGLDPAEYRGRAVDKTLSGGERKKIELASILVMSPKVVLLDEPDSGIDVASLNKIFDVIKILKQKGTTVILITHSETVLQQAEHAFLLCDGTLMRKGVTEKIFQFYAEVCDACEHKSKPIEEKNAVEVENV
ncbi:MAG: ATP-binding cassette domain-containing protein [Candidatus Kapaibacterium sp.]